MIDMTEEEIVDWSIPVPGELVPGHTVPPVALYNNQGLVQGKIESKEENRMLKYLHKIHDPRNMSTRRES
jgi:hypothetical protein